MSKVQLSLHKKYVYMYKAWKGTWRKEKFD